MKSLTLIPATFLCTVALAQDTAKTEMWVDSMWNNSQWEVFGEPVDSYYPLEQPAAELSDSVAGATDTAAVYDFGITICASVTVELIVPIASCDPNTEFFSQSALYPCLTSYMWVWSPPPICCVCQEQHSSSAYSVTICERYNTSVGLSVTDSSLMQDALAFAYTPTNPKEVSLDPPIETPEPTKPAPLPEQPWYQAILPSQRKAWITT